MAVDLEKFVKQLEDSGIIAAETLKDFVPPKANPKSAEDLARELVLKRKLTKFQASEAYQGKAKSLVLGNYVILDKIGAGGMGQVFKAQHRRMKRIVAIKMLPPAVTKDKAAVARFQREVEAAAKLRHTNIVAADDADEAKGVHFLVMEYVEGRDLSALVKKDGPFAIAKAVNYVLQTARGLEFAHKSGVIHRDIKPANLLLGTDGTVKILDMGLARIESGGDVAAQAELTGTGAIMGTVDYMAPEQGVSTKDADARADIYSLGCTLHYLLIGKPVYNGETVTAKLLAHHHHPVPNLRQLRSEVPEQVDTVFRKMVAKKIEDRYQSMTEVVAALERCGVGRDVSFSSQQSFGPDSDDGLLTFLKDIPTGPTHKPKPQKPAEAAGQGGSKNKKPLLVGAGVLGVLALLAGVIISLKSGDDNLIVEVNEPDAVVTISNEEGKIEVTRKTDKTPLSISVDPGKHRLRVEKDGFQFLTKDFVVEAEGKTTLRARMVPVKPAAIVGQPSQRWKTPAFQAWMAATQKLPAEKQIEAVSKKLMELNPGFDGEVGDYGGKGTPKIEKGKVTEFRFDTEKVSDISPVRVFEGLKALSCVGSNTEMGILSDLSPLRGMTLNKFMCSFTQVTDLSPLEGMPLANLYCNATHVFNVLPLESCKDLKHLDIKGTHVTDSDAATLQKALPGCNIHRLWVDSDPNRISRFNTPAFQQWVKATQALPAEKQIEAVSKKLMELNPGFDGKMTGYGGRGTMPKIEAELVTQIGFFTDDVTDLSPVRVLVGLKGLFCSGSGAGKGKLSELSALSGMTLTNLAFSGTQVSDISPLSGMRLTNLYSNGTQVSDLSPLTSIPTLVILDVRRTKVTPAQFAALQKALPNCKIEWDAPAKLAYLDPAFQQWVKATQALPPEQQIEAVSKKLMELNPGFDGKVWPKVENGGAVELTVVTDNVIDISPVRALVGLTRLNCNGSSSAKGMLSDLSPLRGMQLTYLACRNNSKLSDLSPLNGMLLRELSMYSTAISDLSPLAGMKLIDLSCHSTKVSDLSPLRGMPLTSLTVGYSAIADLSPLEACKGLKSLDVKKTKVTATNVAALQKALPNCKIEWDDPAKPKTPEPAASGTR
jgi:serine/threonine protein kinase/Leucine-rich repeat (LRR) protein